MNYTENILTCIDEIRMAENESNMTVVESLIECYDKQCMILESTEFQSDIDCFYQEAKTDKKEDEDKKDKDPETNANAKTSKGKNVFMSIWNGIKKFFGMIVSGLKNLLSKMQSVFKSKKKSVNGVAGDILEKAEFFGADPKNFSKSKYNKPDDIDGWNFPKPNPKYLRNSGGTEVTEESFMDEYDDEVITEAFKNPLVPHYKKPITNKEAKDGLVVTIPSDKKSKIAGATVKLAANGIITSFSDDETKIKIRYIGTGKLNHTWTKQDAEERYDVPGQDKEWYSNPKPALYLMTHPDTRKEITELVDLALKVVKERNTGDKFKVMIEGKMRKLIGIFLTPQTHSFELTFKQITDTQAWASQQLERMQGFTQSDIDISEFSIATITALNHVVRLLMRIQISLNFVSNAMSNDFFIDAAFYGSIKNLALLDKFVDGCVKAGIPPKYVAYNAWLISDECIRGKGGYDPIFGHARATFFPPNKKIVVKIALSGLGVVSNKTEVDFTKMFIDMDRVDLIAPVVHGFENNGIVAMERIHGKFDLKGKELSEYTRRANEALKEYQHKTHKVLNIEISSQHIGNVAYDNKYKCYRSIDYGVHYRTHTPIHKRIIR